MAKETDTERVIRLTCKRLKHYGVTLTRAEIDKLFELDYHTMLRRIGERLVKARKAAKGW